MDICALFQCLHPHVTATTLRQCSRMALAMLVMTGRVTMLGMSRWAGPGGSYRTVQRFFSTVIPWATLFWVFFRHHMYRAADVYLLAGDEVVVTKAGKHTHGLDRFFASLYGKPVPGLAFFMLSLVRPRNGARSRCTSSRWCAAQPRKLPARLKQKPGSGNHPSTNAALGVQRGVRTTAKRKWPSPQSYGTLVPCSTPSSNGSPGISR